MAVSTQAPAADDNQRFGDLNVLPALFAGAAAGAAMITVIMAILFSLTGGMAARLSSEPERSPIDALWMSLPGLVVVFLSAFVLWLVGLLFVGAPGWWLLHRLGLRGFAVAIPYGFLLTLLVAGVFTGFHPEALSYTLIVAVVGAMVAGVVRFLGYQAR